MAKRNRFVVILAMAVVLLMGMFMFTACNPSEGKAGSYNVTFMYKEEGVEGAWKELTKVKSNSDGVISLPEEPVVPGYVFRDWYTDEALTVKFDASKVTKEMTVYAYMADKLVTVNIRKADGSIETIENQKVSKLAELESQNDKAAEASELTFDAFYTNEGYTTAYDVSSEATEIYGRYVALVKYDNGYEVLKKEKLNPGEKAVSPKADKLKKDYMDAEGIVFVSSADKTTPFNFNEAITKNTTIRVNWKSPYLEYEIAEGTTKAFCKGINWTEENGNLVDSFQVLSIPAHVTIEDIEYDVVGADIASYETKSLKKVIFAEGIEHVRGLTGGITEAKLEEVELPSTLKYLEDSFNDLPVVAEKLALPDGLLAIYNCFWNNYLEGTISAERSSGYEFSIKIPASVKNIVSVPNNLTYAEGSTFYNEGNFVYNTDAEAGKTIVGIMQQAVVNNNLTIPEGTAALQVGVFDNIHFDYLALPASFAKVAYNLEKSEHPNVLPKYTRLSVRSAVNTPDANPSESGMSRDGFALIPELDEYKYIVFDSAEYPAEMNKYAFCEWVRGAGNTSVLTPFDQLDRNPLVFVAKRPAGENVNIKVTATNTMINSVSEATISDVVSGGTITQEDLLTKANLTEEKLGYKFKINSIKQFGNDYDFSKNVDSNVYLEIEFAFSATGVTTTEDADGNLVVTGFDQKTAQDMKTNSDPELSKYLIVIPNEIDGKKVVAIKDSAFEDNKKVSRVYVGSNVKTIGKKAFRNAKNLEYFSVTDGALEVVGEEAFMYAGAIQDDNQKWIANPELAIVADYDGLPSLFIQIPLENLKNIEPLAFNTPAIRTFAKTADDEERTSLYSIWIPGKENLEEGKFYYLNGSNDPSAIVKYVGSEKMTINKNPGDKLKIEYYATAGGYYEQESLFFGSLGDFENKSVVSATVKTGSVHLYYYGRCGLCFAMLDKIEKNGIAYLDESYFTVDEKGFNEFVVMNTKPYGGDPAVDCWLKMETFKEQAKSKYVEGNIFADGWYMGQDNTKNDFVDFADHTTGAVPGM